VLVNFLNGFTCQVLFCRCFFENIEVCDWCMCYPIHFTYKNGHKYSWQIRKTKLEQTILRVKHLVFHRALTSSMTYTQFVEFFPLLVFIFSINKHFINSKKAPYKTLDGTMLH
jgi:hypothetical protein